MSANANSTAARRYHHGDLRQALIDAGVAIVAEEQNWAFSLREVARRAGVSHNAPYNHFPEKRDLLDAVAAVGFDRLRGEMRAAMVAAGDASGALIEIAQAYVAFAAGNPALYRLMFGPELAATEGSQPELSKASGAAAKMVLLEVIERGADENQFNVSKKDEASIAMAALSVWSIVHGLAMLIVDEKSDQRAAPEAQARRVMRYLLGGLRSPDLDVGPSGQTD